MFVSPIWCVSDQGSESRWTVKLSRVNLGLRLEKKGPTTTEGEKEWHSGS